MSSKKWIQLWSTMHQLRLPAVGVLAEVAQLEDGTFCAEYRTGAGRILHFRELPTEAEAKRVVETAIKSDLLDALATCGEDETRLSACVKACDGIPTRSLEYGVVDQLYRACCTGLGTLLQVGQGSYPDAREWERRESQLRLAIAKAEKEK